MRYQPWILNKTWEDNDPKLIEAKTQPVIFPHTGQLVNRIPLSPPGILFVRGPRQIGKSTFLREFVITCLKQKVKPFSIVLFDAERFENRHEMQKELELFLKEQNEFNVILVDELTSVELWWKSVKILADAGSFSKTLFIGTGSSSIDLARGADHMPGRRGRRHPVDMELLPVSYRHLSQYLSLEEYFLTGGFPWTVNEYLKLKTIPSHVYQLYGSWLEGAFYKAKHNIQHLPYLLNRLALHQGTPTSVTKLARDCGIGSNSTAETYLSLLEQIYAVMTCHWAEPNRLVPAPRKNRKFYPLDPFLLHIFADFGKGWEMSFTASKARIEDPSILGQIVESAVASELRRRGRRLLYWQGRKEIDFIGADLVEVKWRPGVSINEFKWAETLIGKGKKLQVITQDRNATKGRVELITLRRWLAQTG